MYLFNEKLEMARNMIERKEYIKARKIANNILLNPKLEKYGPGVAESG